MAEFKIICSSQTGELTVNFDELEQQLKQELKKYDYEVTEDIIKQATKDKANINKFAKAIDDKRKEIKNQYCEPLVEFERKMNILRDTAKEGYNKINNQIKSFDEQRKREKQLEITEYFSSLNFSLVPLSKLFEDKWLNKTCDDWKKQLDEKIDCINRELDIIDSFGLAEQEINEIKGYYLDCLDLTTARNMFDEQKKRREAIERQQREVSKPKEQEVVQASYGFVEKQNQEVEQVIEKPKKQRIKFEIVAERPFYDEVNVLIRKYRPQVKILEREDIE